jgi:Matrixin
MNRPNLYALKYRFPAAPGSFLRLIRVAAAFTGFFTVPSLFGYVYESGSPHWPAGTVTFQLALGDAGRTLTDGNTSWDAAAAPAFTIWNQSIGSVQLVSVVNPSAPISQGDHVNTVAFASTFFGSSFGSNTLAITGYYYSSNRNMMEADILFNNRLQWDSYRGALRFGSNGYAIGEIRRVLIHELGHSLGLDHPDQHGQTVAAVMNSVISNIDTAVQDDINGAQSIYGAPGSSSSTPTPTPTPTPSPSATPTPTPTPVPTATPSATPSAATVSVSVSPSVISPGQSATITISISPVNQSTPVTVRYVLGGRARPGRQYTVSGAPGQVTIPAGASSATVTLTAVKAARRPQTVTLFLVSGAGYSLASPRTASVAITR